MKNTIAIVAMLLTVIPVNAKSNINLYDSRTDIVVTPNSVLTTPVLHFASTDIDRFRIVCPSSGITLPIIYISIKASEINKDIQIDWEVVEQSDIEKYEIERSVDGINFSIAGNVTSRPYNNGESYNWLDVNATTGTIYYRVRATHTDGYLFESNTISVKRSEDKPKIEVFPNPVKNQQINIRCGEMGKGKYNFLLRNPQGQQIAHHVIEHAGGSFNQIIYLSKILPAGMYFLQLANEKVEYSQPVFVQ